MTARLSYGALIAAAILTVKSPLALALTPTSIPRHEEICVDDGHGNKIVSKEKLAIRLLKPVDTKWTLGPLDGSSAKYGPERWRQLIADPNICARLGTCTDDDKAAFATVYTSFADLVDTGALQGAYRPEGKTGRSDYFTGPDTSNAIACTETDIPPVPEPHKSKSPLRIRASSDDLYLDRNANKAEFSTLDKASFSVGADGTEHSRTSKVNVAVGYAIGSGFFDTVIPFVSASQSVTHITDTPRQGDDANNVTLGVMGESFFGNDVWGHEIIAKPNFLLDTEHDSRIAGIRLIYAPWTFGKININSATTPLGGGVIISRLIFDIRNDAGHYTSRGDSTVSATNRDFDRFGTRFGWGMSTGPNWGRSTGLDLPALSLQVTETVLHGFAGARKTLSLFQASASISPSHDSPFALTLSYKNGLDEDTAKRVESWTLGIGGHF